jgi:hypothetical protein
LAFHVQKRRRSRIVVLVADAGVCDEEAQNIPPDIVRPWHIAQLGEA